jgi:hypothetical protein
MAAFSDMVASFCTKSREISVQTGVTWPCFDEKKYLSIWEFVIRGTKGAKRIIIKGPDDVSSGRILDSLEYLP